MIKKNNDNSSIEKTLWKTADKLRKNIDASEYKNIVLGLIFLKYISDSFTEKHEQLELDFGNPDSEWYVKEEKKIQKILKCYAIRNSVVRKMQKER